MAFKIDIGAIKALDFDAFHLMLLDNSNLIGQLCVLDKYCFTRLESGNLCHCIQ